MSWSRRSRRSAAAALAITVTAAAVFGLPHTASAAGTTLFDQSFLGNRPDGTGAVALPAAPAGATNSACLTAVGNPNGVPLRSCTVATDPPGSGRLRLTDASADRQGGVFSAASVPTSQGLDVTFNAHQYGGAGPGGDGLAFVLAAVDPANPLSPAVLGPAGGSLGYSAASNGGSAGLSQGYLGVGLDVYGNFSNAAYQGTGCTNPAYISTTGRVPGQVVVRGPGSGGTGYCAINSTAVTTLALPLALRASTRSASVVPVEVVANTTAASFVTASGITVPAGQYRIRFTPVGGLLPLTLSGPLPVVPSTLYPSPSWLNAAGYPKQLAFGWVGSTSSVTDFHEVGNAKAVSFNQVPDLSVTQASYAGLTPQPGDPVTYVITAGVNAGADETVPVSVTQTLPPGVLPRGAYGSGWSCGAPTGQSFTCVSGSGPFPAGTALPPITVVAIVTGTAVTPALIQTATVATASSGDANPGYAATTTPVTPPAAPSGITVSPAAGPVPGANAVRVSGANLANASAIEIGTAAEQQAGAPVVLLPCPSGPAAGCFTTNADGTLSISAMPGRAGAATVNLTVVTRGVAGAAAYAYRSVPAAPTVTAVAAGDNAASLSWSAPADGGSPITGYTVTPYLDGVAQPARTFPAPATTQNITGLTAGSTYTFRVAAINAAGTGPESAASAPVTVNAPPALTFAPPPAGKAYTAYRHQLTVEGGTSPYTWSVSAGSLPDGISLAPATGVLSGTPTVAGSFSFTVRVTDAVGQSATRQVTLVLAALGGLAISVPESASLGTAGAGGGPVTGRLGVVTVTDDRGPAAGSWTASVSMTDFTTGAGAAGEMIPGSAVVYSSGPAVLTTGTGLFVPQPGTAMDARRFAAGWQGPPAGANSAAWNPGLAVTLPAGVVAGTYRAVITHSVL
ncbi:fibronectin type III domain-containing protein [Catellatospora sp. KI3]|uniref:fibronectin type III domain-containing protein n=1 Tax=Catellatospora sp. KI3 TaxID=3041620 RepID=UPI002482FE0C|nr:fibronectin type III domain-containing protein [Catellatospora sp. KI3]MDI1463405.1 fibronectin type III domain-containing protein [Catellatospora sp. KI3]